MKTRLGLALLGATCVGIWAAWPAPRAEPRATTAGEQDLADDSALRAVEARLARVERTQWSAALPQPTAAATVPAAATPAERPPAPPKSSAEAESEYEERFRVDAQDSRVSRETGQRLAEALERPELAGSSLQGVRCGRSVCRMDVRHHDALAKQRFIEAFPTAVPWQTTGLIRFVDDHESLVYLDTPAL